MEIRFSVDVLPKKENAYPKTLYVGESFPEELVGDYVVRELNAQEGLDAQNAFIAAHKEAQENPDESVDNYIIVMLEAATTVNGKPLKLPKLNKLPKKYYDILAAAFEKLNGLSNAEARFLLEPSC